MKFTIINTKELPLVQNFNEFQYKNGTLTVTTSDKERLVVIQTAPTTKVELNFEGTPEEFNVSLDAKAYNFLTACNTAEISFNTQFVIKNSLGILRANPVEALGYKLGDVPPTMFDINVDPLKVAVAFSSDDEKRNFLRGVHLSNGCIQATDAFILYQNGVFKEPGILIPKELLAVIPKGSNIQITNDALKVYATCDNVIYSCRKVEKQFPDLEGSITREPVHTFNVNVKKFKETLEQLLKYIDSTALYVTLECVGGILRFKTEGANALEFDICECGYEFKSHFNPNYLKTIFNSMTGDEVTLEYIAPVKPLFFVNGNKTMLILPINPGKKEGAQ